MISIKAFHNHMVCGLFNEAIQMTTDGATSSTSKLSNLRTLKNEAL